MAFEFDGVSLDAFPDLKECAEKELGETAERRAEVRASSRALIPTLHPER